MKNTKKTWMAAVFTIAVLVLSGCASSQQELSSAGKTGSIKVTVGAYQTITAIDGQPVKFKNTFLLDPGEHDIQISFLKVTLDYKKSGTITKKIVVREGSNYELKTIENGTSTKTWIVLRDVDIPKLTDVHQTIKEIGDPETNNGKNIPILQYYPTDREFEIVGEYDSVIAGGMFATKSLTPERALLYLREFAAKDNIDALVDLWATDLFGASGVHANAIGIRLTDGKGPIAQPQTEKIAGGKSSDLMTAMLAYVGKVLENTAEGSTKTVILMSPTKTITYLPDMGVIVKEGEVEKRGHIGFYTNIKDGIGYVYTKYDDGALTKDQFVDMSNEECDCKWRIVKCENNTVTFEVVIPKENEGVTETFMILVKD